MSQNQKIKNMLYILAVEILTAPVVILFFKLIETKKIASVFASLTFILSGLWIFFCLRRFTDYFSYATYWMIQFQILFFYIPIFLSRIFFWDQNFEDLKFVFLTGDEFHSLSEKSYIVLVLCTLIDVVRVLRKK